MAKDLLSEVLRHQVEIVEEFPGSKLVGKAYQPLFPGAIERGDSKAAWTVVKTETSLRLPRRRPVNICP